MGNVGGEWLVPFKGRNHSGCFDQNFLWKSGNIYVMDNHRAALWCWLQHIDPHQPHSVLHIDRHWDTLPLDRYRSRIPNEWDMTIEEYLSLPFDVDDEEEEDQLFFRWDNYLSIHLEKFRNSLKRIEFATHHDGDFPDDELFYEDTVPWEVPHITLEPVNSPWIANVDLDYFFCSDGDNGIQRLMSDEYIKRIFSMIKAGMSDGRVGVTTIALSPECCGGWKQSERALKVAMRSLGIDFELPT